MSFVSHELAKGAPLAPKLKPFKVKLPPVVPEKAAIAPESDLRHIAGGLKDPLTAKNRQKAVTTLRKPNFMHAGISKGFSV